MKGKIIIDRRTWLLFSTALLAALAVLGMVNAASASLPTGPLSGAPQPQTADTQSKDDPFVTNFNCGDIPTYHIDQQMNLRAAAILQKCGYAPRSQPQSQDKNAAQSSTGSKGSGITAIDRLQAPFLG